MLDDELRLVGARGLAPRNRLVNVDLAQRRPRLSEDAEPLMDRAEIRLHVVGVGLDLDGGHVNAGPWRLSPCLTDTERRTLPEASQWGARFRGAGLPR